MGQNYQLNRLAFEREGWESRRKIIGGGTRGVGRGRERGVWGRGLFPFLQNDHPVNRQSSCAHQQACLRGVRRQAWTSWRPWCPLGVARGLVGREGRGEDRDNRSLISFLVSNSTYASSILEMENTETTRQADQQATGRGENHTAGRSTSNWPG